MSNSLNALVLKFKADTSGVNTAVKAVRKDVNAVNRVLRSTATDQDKLKASTEQLNRVYKTGALPVQEYLRAQAALESKYKGVSAAAQEQEATIARAKRIVSATVPESERLAASYKDLIAAHRTGAITAAEKSRGLAKLKADMARLKKAEKDAADEANGTAEARRKDAAELARVNRLVDRAIPPIVKLKNDHEALGRQYKAGAISTQQYRRALDMLNKEIREQERVSGRSSGITKAFSNSLSALGPAALAATAGTVGFAVAVRGAMAALRLLTDTVRFHLEEIDKLGKTSEKLGVATNSLVGLREAAFRFSGMGAPAVDQALQRMTRRIAEASNGMGEARGALAELGLDAVKLRQAGPSEAFRQIADSIQSVQSPAERLRIAFKLFDSEGAALVNTLAAGRTELDRIQAAMERTGQAVSQADFVKIARANDSMRELAGSATGLSNTLTIAIAPTLKAIVDDVNLLLQGMSGLNRESSGFGENIARAYGYLLDTEEVISNIGKQAARSKLPFIGDYLFPADGIKKIASFDNRDNMVARYQLEVARSTKEAAAALDRFNQTGLDPDGSMGQSSSAMAEFLAQQTAEMERQRKSIEGTIASLEQRNQLLRLGEADSARQDALQEGATYAEANKIKSLILQNKLLEQQSRLEEEERRRKHQYQKAFQAQLDAAETSVRKSFQTPLQELAEELRVLESLRSTGRLNELEKIKAANMAIDSFEEKNQRPSSNDDRVAAVTKNSREEYQLIAERFRGARNAAEKQHSEAQRLRQALLDSNGRLADLLEEIDTSVPVG